MHSIVAQPLYVEGRDDKRPIDRLQSLKRANDRGTLAVLLVPRHFGTVTDMIEFASRAQSLSLQVVCDLTDGTNCVDAAPCFLPHVAVGIASSGILMGPIDGGHNTSLWNELLRIEETVTLKQRRYRFQDVLRASAEQQPAERK